MPAVQVIRVILSRLLLAATLSTARPGFRRYAWLLILGLILGGSAAAWTLGTELLVAFVNAATGTPTGRTVDNGVRASLVVAWSSLVAFVFTLANLVIPSLRRQPVQLIIPERLYSWLAGLSAMAGGLLIGISIFK